MFALTETPETFQQFTEIVEFGKGFMALMLYAALVCGLGFTAVYVMHKNHVHWHWSLLVFGLLMIVFVLLAGRFTLDSPWIIVPGLTLAAFVAMRRGRRWQQTEELEGGERAQIARERITPAWTLRRLVRRAERRSASDSQQPPESRRGVMHALAVLCMAVVLSLFPSPDEEMIFLGYDRDNNRVYVPMKHILLVGATEAGKTTTIRRILEVVAGMQQSMQENIGVVIIDGKSDHDLMLAAKRYAEAVGRRFRHWSVEGWLRYNFLIHGTSGELVDRILATEDFSDDYYLRIAQRFLGFVVRALIAAGIEVTLRSICEYIIPEDLETLSSVIDERNPGAWDWFEQNLPEELDGQEMRAIRGLQHRIAVLAESEIGPLLESGGEGEVLNLLEAVRNGEIVYFDLNANSRRETAKMLGAMIVMDLITIFAVLQRQGETCRTMLIADDIEGFASEAVIEGLVGLYSRVRSSGGMMILGTQTYSDIQVGKGKARLDQLLGSVRTRIIHALPGPDSAEIASKSLGEHQEMQATEHLQAGLGGWKPTGTLTRRPVSVPKFQATELMNLEDGEAVVHVRGGEPTLTEICAPA